MPHDPSSNVYWEVVDKLKHTHSISLQSGNGESLYHLLVSELKIKKLMMIATKKQTKNSCIVGIIITILIWIFFGLTKNKQMLFTELN